MMPVVLKLSEYGSNKAAPHDPSAPGHSQLSGSRGTLFMHTICDKLDTSYCQHSVLAVFFESRDLITPILVGIYESHEIQFELCGG